MPGSLALLVVCCLYMAAYVTYGRWIRIRLGISDSRPTPSHRRGDGVDYVPTRRSVVLGHHFASIAGVGPIVGPILGVTFGWLPALLWIVVGNIFIGAVHDFTALATSLRHDGKSIGSITENYLGRNGKKVFLIFAWCTLVLVIAVFTIVVANTFVAHPEAGTASALFIPIAITFGYMTYARRIRLLLATAIGVAALFVAVWLGMSFPLSLSYDAWVALLLAYVSVASVTPVWLLLQPRDYLNSFLLYVLLIGGFVGLLLYRPTLKLEAFAGWSDPELGALFPILFVTVACGAISGFHSLVASGTTAKQLDREGDAQIIGYGSMLLEGVLATIALIAAAMLTRDGYTAALRDGGPVALFSRSLGSFGSTIGIPVAIGASFVALTISVFALTTLDTSARLGRYAFQEFFEKTRHEAWLTRRGIATLVTVLAGALLAINKGGTMAMWPLFGAANQMLAALALLTVFLYLSHRAVGNRFVLFPAVFMFVVTLSAIGWLIIRNLEIRNFALALIAIVLGGAALYLAGLGFRRHRDAFHHPAESQR
ncbi:MAG: carbon starvation protein A [Vicinamibacteria bacterium]|nr:carbon starvation protein A [Vicinamibacteria bacterium]